MISDQLVFIVDLNEVDVDGRTTASMDFTVNYGPFQRRDDLMPTPGTWVYAHYDEDDTLYLAEVLEVLSDRDFRIRIQWDTCEPVMNKIEWSAHVPFRPDSDRVTSNVKVDVGQA